MAFYPISMLPPQFSNPSNGENASGFILQARIAGTTTLTDFYSDSAGTSVGSSITLDSGGFTAVSGNVFVPYLDDSVTYKFTLTDPDTLIQFTVDNLTDVSNAQVIETVGAITSYVFENVADLQTQTTHGGTSVTLVAGYMARTQGYYAAGDGGGSLYMIKTAAQAATDSDVIDEMINHTLPNGNVAILAASGEVYPKQCGAKLDGTFDDSTYIKNMVETRGLSVSMDKSDVMWLSTAASYPISIAAGVSISGGTIKSDVQINFGVDNDTRLFEVNAADVVLTDIDVNLEDTITGANNGLGVFCRFTNNAHRFVVERCNFSNVYSEAYVFVLTINANARDWLVRKCTFENLDVKENTVEGDLNGSLRAIHVGYNKVGTYSNAIAGSGTIEQISCVDLLQYEDTDGIQIIGTTGHVPGDYIVRNIYCENVGKRGVKIQHEGVIVSDVTVDATGITHALGYMFSAVAALNDNVLVENIYGIGVFKAGISSARTVKLRNITLVSTAAAASVSGTWTALLHDFGGTYDVADVQISGNWLNHAFIGPGGFTSEPIFEVLMEKITASTAAEAESIRIDSSLNGATAMTLVKLSNMSGMSTSDSGRSGIRIGHEDDITTPNITRVEMSDIQSATNGYFTTITVNAVTCHAVSLVLSGASTASFEGAYLSAGRMSNITSTGQARIANFSSCSNVWVTSSNCVDKTSDYAVRFNNSSDNAVTNMLLGTGMLGPVVNAGTASNNQSTAIITI